MHSRQFASVLLAISCAVISSGQSSTHSPPTIRVDGPTVVAFFEYDDARRDTESESDEALADFQFYAEKEKNILNKKGIGFREVYAHSFRIRMGNISSVVSAEQFEGGAGYYLIAPGKKPRIEQGIMTDADLLEAAKSYFSPSGK